MGELPDKMFVTTDAVTFSVSPEEGLRVLLVRRANDPHKGDWALPGGFVDLDEDLPDACARELEEETGIPASAMVQIGAWGKPGRDPRGRNVTVAFLTVVGPAGAEPQAADDAAAAAWYPVGGLPPLAFDHGEILSTALAKLRLMALSTHVAFGLLPERFHLADLRRVLCAVLDVPVTIQQAGTVAGCASLEVDSPADEGEPSVYRCVAADFLTGLRQS